MIDSLHIQNYRLFKDLKIDKLGQVNLIAGKNNTGKTALLEALRIYLNNGSFAIITNTIFTRGDLDKSNPLESMATLFGTSKPYQNSGIDYTFTINNLSWGLTMRNNQHITRHNGNPGSVTGASQNIDFFNYENPNDETIYVRFKSDLDISIKTNYWENIEFNPIERQKAVDFLNIMSPKKINQISISNGIVRIQLENGNIEKLTKWGDGANRLLTIALALINAKNKTLLIDEFEVGLHHSIQKQLWEIIFKYAKEWNIQVFVTTHSHDTVKAFATVWNEKDNLEMGQYFRLTQDKTDPSVIYPEFYDNEELLSSIYNLEPR
jgi:AAA15 family ATPase/GTPase